MISIADKDKYLNYQKNMGRFNPKKRILVEFIFPCLIYASMGAITWAIRGTSDWGGTAGALVPGMTWGILWYYFSYKRGIDARESSFWLGLSVALGGFWGYAQYRKWIRGIFALDSSSGLYISVHPLYGYLWFWIIGALWLGIAGIILGWALENENFELTFNEKIRKWLPRLLIPACFAIIGYIIRLLFPQLIFPLYSESLYTEAGCPECMDRTIPLNTANFVGIMWWIGATITALIQKDKKTYSCSLFLGIGFGFLYTLSASSNLLGMVAPSYIDWWKIWEINAGLTGGLLIGVLQYFLLRKFEKNNPANDENKEMKQIDGKNKINEAIDLKKPDALRKLPQNVIERRANLCIALVVIILLMILIYGIGERLGIFLELYTKEDLSDKPMPFERLILFVPGASIVVYWGLKRLITIFKKSRSPDFRLYSDFKVENLDEKLNALFALIVLIGAISIWPKEIGVIYVFYYVIASIFLRRYLRYIK